MRVFFLPGATGSGEFWTPVAERLPRDWEPRLFDWPGLGMQPPDPSIRSFDDLVALVLESISGPVHLVAQSMGGAVAMRVALARPSNVRSLVLVATSGGIDVSRFQMQDWRSEYRAEYPHAMSFVTDEQPADLSDQLATVTAPALLIWGKEDPISPPTLGEHLASKLPNARLVVLDHADHMFARDHAETVAPLIQEHLSSATAGMLR
jgi:2-hydroxy-6-oxonona-2,4-dienedioate hydrolase